MADPDRRTPLLESYENAAVIVSGISAEQVTFRTPCPAYDVTTLIDHLVEAAYRAAALGRGRIPPAGDGSPHVELSDAPAQLRRAAEEAAEAWGVDSRLSSSFTMPWGEEYSGATLVNMYLAELAAHAWDLAFATGQLDRLDPSLAVAALDGARAMIKPEYRDMVATGSPFGAEVPAAPDADDWERLAAFMGRDPRASLDRSRREGTRTNADSEGEPMIEQVVAQWHAYLSGERPDGLDDLLDDDVVFYSPIVFTPQRGKEITRLYLQAAGQTFAGGHSSSKRGSDSGERFHYTKSVIGGDTAVLEFETTMEGKYVNGVDIIRCNEEGRIIEFRVMIRPLQAVNLVHQQMAAMLDSMSSGD